MYKNSLSIILAIASCLILIRCNHEENEPDPSHAKVLVEFSRGELSVSENSEEKIIDLNLGKPALEAGSIKIAVDTAYVKYYHSTPAVVNGILTLPIAKGKEAVSFSITPKNDLIADEDRRIEFRLQEVSGMFQAGTRNKFSLTIADDERTSPLSYANFIPANATIKETYGAGITLQVHLSESATVEGNIIVRPTSATASYGQQFTTEPPLVNGALTLAVTPGSAVVSFKVIPLDNAVITGEHQIDFSIWETSGNIKKGIKLKEVLRIADDELLGKPKGYEQAAGSWRVRKNIEYDELGRIYKEHVETETPGSSTRTETYFYAADGRLEKINVAPNTDQIYTWQNDRIIKSEKVTDGVVKSYVLYDYDDQGNISSVISYYLQPNGQFLMGFQSAYLYFNDGNLYKILLYNASEEGEEPVLISTRTYDGYIDAVNPFPMVEILPTVKTQTKLPTVYRVEEGGIDLLYNVSYEFRADGLVGKRIASGTQDSEVVAYSYYE